MTISQFRALFFASCILAAPMGQAQSTSAEERDAARLMAEEISVLMTDLEARAEGFPAVLEALAEGKANIEQADETVDELISQLNRVTDEMDDNSEFDQAIDDFKTSTTELISEAEASTNEAIRGLIPDLQETLTGLESDDEQRSKTVVDARNLIRTLEENKETISFFIRAGEVQKAAEMISANVGDFANIVERGKAVADGLLEAANP